MGINVLSVGFFVRNVEISVYIFIYFVLCEPLKKKGGGIERNKENRKETNAHAEFHVRSFLYAYVSSKFEEDKSACRNVGSCSQLVFALLIVANEKSFMLPRSYSSSALLHVKQSVSLSILPLKLGDGGAIISLQQGLERRV